MLINLNQENVYSLEGFVNDENVSQGVVELNHLLYSENNEKVQLFKVQGVNGDIVVLKLGSYNQTKISTDRNGDNFEFLFSIDKARKIIIYGEYYKYDILKLLSDFVDESYKIWENEKLSEYIKSEYRNNVLRLFERNINSIKGNFPQFEEVYVKTLNNEMKNVENDYLVRDFTIDNYNLYIKEMKNKDFDGDVLDSLQKFLINPSLLHELALEYFQEKTEEWAGFENLMENFAIVTAKRELIKSIIDNPSDFVKLSNRIKNSVKDGGKTLNVLTKDGRTIKVENRFRGYHFPTVAGYNDVKIEDIQSILFSRKVLFEA